MSELFNSLPKNIGSHHLMIDFYDNTIGYIKYNDGKKFILKMIKFKTLDEGITSLYEWGIKYKFINNE